jgi:hypothetical protein
VLCFDAGIDTSLSFGMHFIFRNPEYARPFAEWLQFDEVWGIVED